MQVQEKMLPMVIKNNSDNYIDIHFTSEFSTATSIIENILLPLAFIDAIINNDQERMIKIAEILESITK